MGSGKERFHSSTLSILFSSDIIKEHQLRSEENEAGKRGKELGHEAIWLGFSFPFFSP